MTKEQITTIILGIVAIISILATVMLSFRTPQKQSETAEVIKALAPLIQKELQAQAPPQIINRVNSNDIKDSNTQPCCDNNDLKL